MQHGFLNMVSRGECETLLRGFPLLSEQSAPLAGCRGRVLAFDVIAVEDLPLVHRSSMDGYAVRASDIFGASESNPAYLEIQGQIAVDRAPNFQLAPGACAAITTGGTLPEGADSVLMVEHAQDLGGGAIEAWKSLAPGENVMFRGEDATRGKTLLPAGTLLRAPELGLLAAQGIAVVEVHRRPLVGVISTGDELVPMQQTPRPGQVRDVNSPALACMIEDAGAEARLYGLIPDQLDALTTALAKAVEECDAVFISGGSSVGIRDLTIDALRSLPESMILAHGVAISPGKPTIVASVGGVPVLGLPGQVASAQVIMLVFGMPLLRHLTGDRHAFDHERRHLVKAELAQNLASRQGREEYVRVRMEKRLDELPLAWPRLGKSGLLKTLIEAHGLVCIEPNREGLPQGAEVNVWLL